MTTSDPSLASEIATAAEAVGSFSVDAPVSGGDRGARNATLSIFAGGNETVINELSPLFKFMGTVRYMGGPGSGQRAKLGNQIVIASTMVGLVEGMVYAHKSGLDVAKWLEAISTGAAGSKSLELYGKRILDRDMAAGFYVHHFVKDLGICLSECQRMGLALPGLALAHQLYVSLMAHGEGGLGTQALILAVERFNNTCLSKKDWAMGMLKPKVLVLARELIIISLVLPYFLYEFISANNLLKMHFVFWQLVKHSNWKFPFWSLKRF
jgi:3-hydroxyisobutyrate dehydrogenase